MTVAIESSQQLEARSRYWTLLANRGLRRPSWMSRHLFSIEDADTVVEKATGGSLDKLINNAAMFSLMPLADAQLDDASKSSRPTSLACCRDAVHPASTPVRRVRKGAASQR
ncbi:uncharacterized protein BCR38DRAFT_7969 [Pseudomassariella vexata]|uniref:Uncharacterized protein n=1 Tax=Pseudomassariella vexata TaxID=1141098 RepID=A0A1Y2EIB7_9PEZI|nr:uncharacterized protein BCR38DRAFT_7969 [Pseudomassariella vexata]ORY71322.1 hypothetical protein BCR38DRAFT_7969 [Pseudomassariella vexata]